MTWIEMDIEEFKKKYPNLAKEILEGAPSLSMRVRNGKVDPWRGYNPTVIDFIRRANTVEEALEVIDYMEKRGEIDHEYAERLRTILREEGLRAFGSKKEPGYYFKAAGYC